MTRPYANVRSGEWVPATHVLKRLEDVPLGKTFYYRNQPYRRRDQPSYWDGHISIELLEDNAFFTDFELPYDTEVLLEG